MVAQADGHRFAVEVRPVGEAVVLALSGELDHDTAEPLRTALAASASAAATARDGGQRVLVDFTQLQFCDSTGLNVLLHGRLAVQEAGGTLELVGLRQPVARMFRITGAEGVFPVHADVEEALATPQRR